jgi:predicted nuclease of predicted toxin-antitoxin system
MMRFLANENLHIEIVRGLRQANYEVLFVPDLGLAGHKDREILEYSEKNDLIVISGDKDFGGLTEFGPLWGRGKVILLRYRLINIQRIVRNILEILDREAEAFRKEKAMVIVLSEAGYRIHRRGELNK